MGWFPINPFSNKSPLLSTPNLPLLPSFLIQKKNFAPFLFFFEGWETLQNKIIRKRVCTSFHFEYCPSTLWSRPLWSPPLQIASHPIPLLPPQTPPPFYTHRKENELCSHCHSMGWIVLKYKINWKWFWVLHHPPPSHPIKFPYNKPPSLIPRWEATESNKFLAG